MSLPCKNMPSQLALRYGHTTKPKKFVATMFMYTMNTTARTVMMAMQNTKTGRWRAMAYIKYMYMLITWMAVGVLRPVLDYFPFSLGPPATSRPYLLEGRFGIPSLSSSFTSFPSSGPSSDMILYEGYDAVPVQALGGALSQASFMIYMIR